MPGLVKVGKSTRSPEIRATELSQASGVPHSFQIVYQTLVDNCDLAEREVHRFLNAFRENSNREFFRIPVNRTIDVLRKVISENNLKESDHEIDPYRFAFEEFHSAEALFEKVISNDKYWEQAKLHLKEGFLMNWLKSKSEFDALVNAEQFKSRKDDFDYYFALIVFSIVPGDFRIFGYNIFSAEDIRNYFEKEFKDDKGFLDLFLSEKLSKIYEGYLNSKGIYENEVSKLLTFINSSIGLPLPERKSKLRMILEWKFDSLKFLHFDTLDFQRVDFLMKKSDWNKHCEILNIPADVKEKAHSKIELDVIECIKYINRVRELVFEDSEIENGPVKRKDLSLYISKSEFLKEIKELNGKEYIAFLECQFTIQDFIDFNKKYVLPRNLNFSLLNPLSFYDFLIARDCLRFLLGDDKMGDNYPNFRVAVLSQYYNYYKKLFKAFENFGVDPASNLIIKNKIFTFNNLDQFKEQVEEGTKLKQFFPNERGLVYVKTELEKTIKQILETYLIPNDLKNDIIALNLKTLGYFLVDFINKIELKKLEDKVINQKLIFALKNGFEKDYHETLTLLTRTYKPQKDNQDNFINGFKYKKVEPFSIEFIPTNEFLLTLSLPNELRQQLRSDDVVEYLKGLESFFEFAKFWVPIKTHKILEEEFVFPDFVLKGLVGFSISEYKKSVEFIVDQGFEIVNGLEQNTLISGTRGFQIITSGINRKFELNNRSLKFSHRMISTSNDFSIYEKGKFYSGLKLTESLEKVKGLLSNKAVQKTCLIWYDNNLILKKHYSEYEAALGQIGLSYFCSIYKLSPSNYIEAKNILISQYDKRLDSKIGNLIKNIDLKFIFLPEGLREYLKDYLTNIMKGNISCSKWDLSFISELDDYSQMNYFSLVLKKKKFLICLKESYARFAPINFHSESFLNYLIDNS